MNELLITLLVIALVYYFYAQQQKPHPVPTKTHSQSTQTETEPITTNQANNDNQELENTLDQLITNIQELNHQLN